MAPSTAMRMVFENPDLCQDILVRVSSEPKFLVRLRIVCSGWNRILTDHGFLRRYRLQHGDPPMIGYVQNTTIRHHADFARFVSTIPGFGAQVPRYGLDLEVVDSRHGRVLFLHQERSFIVWDPIAELEQEVRMPDDFPVPSRSHFAAAVLCDAHGLCDHNGCHDGHFRIIFLGFRDGRTSAIVYESDSDLWTPSPATAAIFYHHIRAPAALVGSNLHFLTSDSVLLYKFGPKSDNLSFLKLPDPVFFGGRDIHGAILLPSMDKVTLAIMCRGKRCSRIRFWDSAIAASTSTGDVQWVAQVEARIPVSRAQLVGGGATSLFIHLPAKGIHVHEVTRFDLGSGRLQKLQKVESGRLSRVVPFVSFYQPPGPIQDVAASGHVAIEKDNTASTNRTDGDLQ